MKNKMTFKNHFYPQLSASLSQLHHLQLQEQVAGKQTSRNSLTCTYNLKNSQL